MLLIEMKCSDIDEVKNQITCQITNNYSKTSTKFRSLP